MKRALTVVMMCVSLIVAANAEPITNENWYAELSKDWHAMSEKERSIIMREYIEGSKHDLGYTLGAIVWQESKGGRWQVNPKSGDYGLYHVNIYWFLKRMGIKSNHYTESKYATILITDVDYARNYVILFLKTLLKRNGNNYYKVWSRYNGCDNYADNILYKVRFLRTIMKE